MEIGLEVKISVLHEVKCNDIYIYKKYLVIFPCLRYCMLPTTILTQNQKRSVINFAGTCDVYAVWVGLTWPVSCWLRLACWKNLNWKGCRNIHLALFLLKVHSQPGNKHTSRVEFACLILCWLRRSWIIRTASLGMVSRLYNYTTTRNCSLLFPWTMRRWVLGIGHTFCTRKAAFSNFYM